MNAERVDVIATSISGSIRDWSKVERIEPLFRQAGFEDVGIHVAASHAEARRLAGEALAAGGRLLISAGGSGTFNAVLEGCCDAKLPLDTIRLGFLRKGSADLIGKVLGMPDEIEAAVEVFARAIREDVVRPCDLLRAAPGEGEHPPRHFVGYGGAEIFGRIPHFTENRFMKWYKGVLSQVFGDLGPFTTGMSLAVAEKLLRSLPRLGRSGRRWRLRVDGRDQTEGAYQALILVNGYLGPELPWSDDPLGSGRFHLFALRDLGLRRFFGQIKRARGGGIQSDPERWGFEHHIAIEQLELELAGGGAFPLNVDGSTLPCRGRVLISRVDSIPLLARRKGELDS